MCAGDLAQVPEGKQEAGGWLTEIGIVRTQGVPFEPVGLVLQDLIELLHPEIEQVIVHKAVERG